MFRPTVFQETKVRDVEIDGATLPIYVTEAGTFYTKYEALRFEAGTLKTLVEKVRKHMRTHTKIAIPCTLFEESYGYDREDGARLTVTQITLTGMHGRNRNILYRDEKTGKADQSSGYRGTFYRRLTAAEIQEVFRLRKAKREADKALEEYLEARHISAADEIRKVQAALDPETAKVDADGEPV